MTLIEKLLAYPVGLVVRVNHNAPFTALWGVCCTIVSGTPNSAFIAVVPNNKPDVPPYNVMPYEVDYVE